MRCILCMSVFFLLLRSTDYIRMNDMFKTIHIIVSKTQMHANSLFAFIGFSTVTEWSC